ncbi:sensor histidine kinase [Paraburkholderia sediminicola]|uniref:sensor histidine kinase n=2 Tax=Paraburkholderia sediminicola TaxID=458836 RepID=UPI000E7071FA
MGIKMSANPVFARPPVGAPPSYSWYPPYQASFTNGFVECTPRQAAVVLSNGSLRGRRRLNAPQLTDEILAVVAHELRGPLTPLRLAARVIRLASAGQPEVLRMTDTIDRQIDAIARLAEDLMDATRVGRGELRVSKVQIDLTDFLTDPLEAVTLAAARRSQTLTIQIPSGTLYIEGDPVRLSQALNNLLHNAVKYTPSGGHINVAVLADRNDLVVSVKDDGLGVSAALLPHIFDLFTQSGRTIAASAGGLGIGLAVVKAIAGSHGGMVSARSAGPGTGSEFILRLPIVVGQGVVCDHI